MPKPKKSSSKQPSETKTQDEPKGPIVKTKDGDLAICIQVKPGAKSIEQEAVSVQIAAPPVDGEANTEIIKYFAELLKLRKADVSLKGGKSRQKTVTISSSTGLTSETILELLRSHKD